MVGYFGIACTCKLINLLYHLRERLSIFEGLHRLKRHDGDLENAELSRFPVVWYLGKIIGKVITKGRGKT